VREKERGVIWKKEQATPEKPERAGDFGGEEHFPANRSGDISGIGDTEQRERQFTITCGEGFLSLRNDLSLNPWERSIEDEWCRQSVSAERNWSPETLPRRDALLDDPDSVSTKA
jgi:hypothetical protein